MAVTVTNIKQGTYSAVFSIEMTADGDTTATWAHGLPSAPDDVDIVPLLPQAYIGQYRLTGITATQITVTKGNIVGSGAVGDAVRVVAKLTHSIQQ